LDVPVLVFAMDTTLLAGIGFSMVPAMHAVKQNVFGALRSGTRVEGTRGRRARRVLLVAQLALALVVLVGAALLQSSFQRLQAVELGFEPARIVAVPIALTAQSYRGCRTDDAAACDEEVAALARQTFLAEVTDRLDAIRGVEAAGATNIPPLSGSGTVAAIAVEGQARRTQAEARFADWRAVTPGFFQAMGLPLRSGRNFTTGEAQDGEPVVIVSAAFAASFLPGEEAVGRRIAFGTSGTNWRTIVGVVGDIRDRTVDMAVRPMLFVPHRNYPWPQVTMLVRTVEDGVVHAAAIRAAIASVDASLPVPTIRPLEEYRRDALGSARFSTLLMSLFAACALVLAVLGVYAVTLYEVTRRTREFGLRVALGAGRERLLRQVLGESARPLMLGLAIGMAGSLGGSWLLRTVLFEAPSIQAIPFGAAVATLVASVLLAGLVPALRATRVDPAVALSAD
jgi:putative ABC transport system permease protein